MKKLQMAANPVFQSLFYFPNIWWTRDLDSLERWQWL